MDDRRNAILSCARTILGSIVNDQTLVRFAGGLISIKVNEGQHRKFLPDGSRQQNDQLFVKNMREINIPTAAAFGILAVRDNTDNIQRLACGRDWQRIHLWGATQGLAFQPLHQMCERVDRERQMDSQPVLGQAVQELLSDDTWQACFPFRLGYPTQADSPSPRRGLPEVLA